MRRSLQSWTIAASGTLVLAMLAVTTPAPSASATPVSASRPAVATESSTARTTRSTSTAAKKKPRYLGPAYGITYNNANGKSRYRNLHKILRAINHAPRGSSIRMVTWSYFYGPGTDALIAAHKRGVSVRLVMARAKSKESHDYRRLKRALGRYGNKYRPYALKSGAKACAATCRGHAGTMHAKMFMFSRTGPATDVIMWGSPNFTRASATLQWNDLFTWKYHPTLYDYGMSIFDQMWQDKEVAGPYKVVWDGSVGLGILPYRGTGDWVSNELRTVRCSGATGGTGAVIRGTIGNRIATYLKKLWDQGCDIRILYTVRGVKARQILLAKSGRGPVPMRHYVQDTNGDGFYDKYLHMKVLVITGVMGSQTDARFVMNGSENWADMARGSDEEVGYFKGGAYTGKYLPWLNWLWHHVPKSAPFRGPTNLRKAINPYAHVDLD
jgi:phosphatidylserine/phosphatidylglycerophosphate/cardiolipin synthase-like enzyme